MLQFELPGPLVSEPRGFRNYPVSNLGSRRPPAYRPLGLDLSGKGIPRRQLGQSLPSVSVGPALAFLAVGGAGFYLSDIFPPPSSSIMKVVGIAVAGYGVYSLFTLITGSPSIDKGVTSSAPPAPVMSAAAFDRVTGLISFPASGSKPDISSPLFGADNFSINVIWTNSSSEVGNFDYDILATSVAGPGAVIPASQKAGVVTSVTKAIAPSSVRGLGPVSSSAPGAISVDLFQPPDRGTYTGLVNQPAPYFSLYLQLRKIGPNGPVPVGNLVQFGPFDWK